MTESILRDNSLRNLRTNPRNLRLSTFFKACKSMPGEGLPWLGAVVAERIRPETCSPKSPRMRKISAISVLFLAIGCSNAQPPARAPEESRTDDLVSSLQVEISRDTTVGLVFHLTNSGTQPVVLEFNTAQRYDFEVRTTAGNIVWRWSDDQMFAQMMGSETIPPGASREFRERWNPGGRTGSFIAVGRVVAMNRPIEQRTQFEIRR